ncbi:uncharacterized protein EV422DRAFT_570659 [Fimicolochytrium jonesii]|uniref:uncharacterized protein n=1 Tax=Fimicolochytrium jonesii TaxID=1396493 RepID=UPI0022FDD6A1|nr:uncharacterized protein EV422DRAFT_570659 [Fimicolochytrium jonesii]KAI8817618.1 hypothetical protein EV422DRAFT_570659 [Fimicolochytrium jonesii]
MLADNNMLGAEPSYGHRRPMTTTPEEPAQPTPPPASNPAKPVAAADDTQCSSRPAAVSMSRKNANSRERLLDEHKQGTAAIAAAAAESSQSHTANGLQTQGPQTSSTHERNGAPEERKPPPAAGTGRNVHGRDEAPPRPTKRPHDLKTSPALLRKAITAIKPPGYQPSASSKGYGQRSSQVAKSPEEPAKQSPSASAPKPAQTPPPSVTLSVAPPVEVPSRQDDVASARRNSISDASSAVSDRSIDTFDDRASPDESSKFHPIIDGRRRDSIDSNRGDSSKQPHRKGDTDTSRDKRASLPPRAMFTPAQPKSVTPVPSLAGKPIKRPHPASAVQSQPSIPSAPRTGMNPSAGNFTPRNHTHRQHPQYDSHEQESNHWSSRSNGFDGSNRRKSPARHTNGPSGFSENNREAQELKEKVALLERENARLADVEKALANVLEENRRLAQTEIMVGVMMNECTDLRETILDLEQEVMSLQEENDKLMELQSEVIIIAESVPPNADVAMQLRELEALREQNRRLVDWQKEMIYAAESMNAERASFNQQLDQLKLENGALVQQNYVLRSQAKKLASRPVVEAESSKNLETRSVTEVEPSNKMLTPPTVEVETCNKPQIRPTADTERSNGANVSGAPAQPQQDDVLQRESPIPLQSESSSDITEPPPSHDSLPATQTEIIVDDLSHPAQDTPAIISRKDENLDQFAMRVVAESLADAMEVLETERRARRASIVCE